MLGLPAQMISWLFPDFLTLEGLWGYFGAFYLSFFCVCVCFKWPPLRNRHLFPSCSPLKYVNLPQLDSQSETKLLFLSKLDG